GSRLASALADNPVSERNMASQASLKPYRSDLPRRSTGATPISFRSTVRRSMSSTAEMNDTVQGFMKSDFEASDFGGRPRAGRGSARFMMSSPDTGTSGNSCFPQGNTGPSYRRSAISNHSSGTAIDRKANIFATVSSRSVGPTLAG